MEGPIKKLSIAFYWHMHQPVYQLSPEGDYIMPWVRLHAVKDYLDMVTILDKFQKTKLNFNLVPVLLDALMDYGEKDFHDIHSRLTVKNISDLSGEDKTFILNNFFDANYQTMISPFARYNELYQRYTATADSDINIFTDPEYSDLMALFNIVWMDPIYKNVYPELGALIEKSSGYTQADRIKIIEIHRDIIRKIIPAYKHYVDQGRIEVTTSPYYHSILPILIDIKDAYTGDDLPDDLEMADDARIQVERALNRVEALIGKRPAGIWPSEQSVSPKMLDLLSKLGVKWTISDEGVLAASINYDFVRDFNGAMENPYPLMKTYNYKGVNMIFRNAFLPNLISFEYHNYDSDAAANDFYDRIKVAQSRLLSSPDDNHLLTIAMDGENCWENYQDDGSAFLSKVYELIEKDDTLETVLISDYLAKDIPKKLPQLAAGSWINHNFKVWIDEPLKNLAWCYLSRVHADFAEIIEKNPQNPNIELARRELFICEGSDWFWWYGEPNNSSHDNLFDYIFREHLKNVYIYLGADVPEFLDEPLLGTIDKPSRYPRCAFTPKLDGMPESEKEWLNSGCIDIADGPVHNDMMAFSKICFGSDKDNIYFRLYINPHMKNIKQLRQLYVYTRNRSKHQILSPIRVIHKTKNLLPVGREKFHDELIISVGSGEIEQIRIASAMENSLWVLEPSDGLKSVYGEVIDISVAFDKLGIAPGDVLEFLFVNANHGINDFYIPNDMLLTIQRAA